MQWMRDGRGRTVKGVVDEIVNMTSQWANFFIECDP